MDSGGCLPCTSHRRPDGTGRRAVVHYVGDRLFPSFSRGLQTCGAETLVAFALICALPVAMVYVDIQVVALFLGDDGVRNRLGDSGQAGTALLGGKAREEGVETSGEGAWLLPCLSETSVLHIPDRRVGKAHALFGLARLGYGPL